MKVKLFQLQSILDYLLDLGYFGLFVVLFEDVQSRENSEIKSFKSRLLGLDVGGQLSKFGGLEFIKKKFFEVVMRQVKGFCIQMDNLEFIL